MTRPASHALASLAVAALLATATAAQDAAPSEPRPEEGFFVTVDDQTGEARGLVELRRADDGTLAGYLRGSFDPTHDFNGVCATCSGELEGRTMDGLAFVWGLEPDGEGRFRRGRIQDPETGSTYRSKATFADDFSTLDLRGYVGSPILGRTQTWRRASAEEIAEIDRNNAAFGIAPLETP